MSKKLFPLFALSVILFLSACSSTKVISSWSIEPASPEVMKKVLVVGIMNDRESRDNLEISMANELNKTNKVQAVTSISLFGPKQFAGLTEEEITDKLKGSDFTSVMIISLLEKEKEKDYTPGYYYYTPRVYGYNRYYRRYLYVYDEMYTPGYYTTSTKYVMQADVYTVNDDDELVYSAQTRSSDPKSVKSLAESFSDSIVKELKEKGLIK